MKRIVWILLAMILAAGCISCAQQQNPEQTPSSDAVVTELSAAAEDSSMEDSAVAEESSAIPAEALRYILHAGGVTPNGIVGSNSLEALDYSYERGFRVMEMDFCWTEDDYLVCVHDWDAYYAHKFNKTCVTMEEFESVRYGTYGFTSMTLYDLADWMVEHPDAVIVTDIKDRSMEGAALIAERYPDLLDRFCFQIYSKADFDPVRALGFENIILTIYQLPWEEKIDPAGLAEYARTHDLVGLTYPLEIHEWYEGYTDILLTAQTPLFMHTINDAEQQQALFDLGIAGIYTDNGGT